LSDYQHHALRIDRRGDGGIRFICGATRLEIDAAEWARLVAAVTLRGESSAMVAEVFALHMKPQP
jgi:hypothetical protein